METSPPRERSACAPAPKTNLRPPEEQQYLRQQQPMQTVVQHDVPDEEQHPEQRRRAPRRVSFTTATTFFTDEAIIQPSSFAAPAATTITTTTTTTTTTETTPNSYCDAQDPSPSVLVVVDDITNSPPPSKNVMGEIEQAELVNDPHCQMNLPADEEDDDHDDMVLVGQDYDALYLSGNGDDDPDSDNDVDDCDRDIPEPSGNRNRTARRGSLNVADLASNNTQPRRLTAEEHLNMKLSRSMPSFNNYQQQQQFDSSFRFTARRNSLLSNRSSNNHVDSHHQHNHHHSARHPFAGTGSTVSFSRRSSLDSCASHSSGPSTCFSSVHGSFASCLSTKDEAYRRTKILEGIEWLSRHLADHVMVQLMDVILEESRKGKQALIHEPEHSHEHYHQQHYSHHGSRRNSIDSWIVGADFNGTWSPPRRTSTAGGPSPTLGDPRNYPARYGRRFSHTSSSLSPGSNIPVTLRPIPKVDVKGDDSGNEDLSDVSAASSPIQLQKKKVKRISSSFLHYAPPPLLHIEIGKQKGENCAQVNISSNDGGGRPPAGSIAHTGNLHDDRLKHRWRKTKESLDALIGVGPAVDPELGYENPGINGHRLNVRVNLRRGSASLGSLGYASCSSPQGKPFPLGDHGDIEPSLTTTVPLTSRHDCALLFVDISGFTNLSTLLHVEKLSKTINDYFQMIVEEVQAYGGDILRFAGDALFAEWQATAEIYENDEIAQEKCQAEDSEAELQVESLQLQKEFQSTRQKYHKDAVWTAAACAARIVEKCSNYHVYDDLFTDLVTTESHETSVSHFDGGTPATTNTLSSKMKERGLGSSHDTNKRQNPIATLNLHCGIGFGHIVGIHAGDSTKREYLILGDPIKQVANAIAVGCAGEVVASPQAQQFLQLEEHNAHSGVAFSEEASEEGAASCVIFSAKLHKFASSSFAGVKPQAARDKLRPYTDASQSPPDNHPHRSRHQQLLELWDFKMLLKLQQRMSLYVHPIVVEGELFTTIYHNRDNKRERSKSNESIHSTKDQEMLLAEAEIRDVFTLFLQPLVSVELSDIENEDNAQDQDVLILLNRILVVANRELARFRGHLRQFIVDDKGVVLIANFGLRGSVFPHMIEEYAMPFAASIQSVLKNELGVECRMGGSYGTAFAGVIGSVDRHEYAVLGQSVNLAARLMAMGNRQNKAFLVDASVRRRAPGWEFNTLTPVEAKGYKKPVPIFEPIMHNRRPWKHVNRIFIGRKQELETIVSFADDVLNSPYYTTKMVLISSGCGCGKSSLMSEAVTKIQASCEAKSRSHIVVGQVCCEADLFRPLSVVGPLFLDILSRKAQGSCAPQNGPFGGCDNDSASGASEPSHGSVASLLSLTAEKFMSIAALAQIPKNRIETIHYLAFNHAWPRGRDAITKDGKIPSTEQEEIARSIAAIILRCTLDFDLVLLALDDIFLMDEMSWMVIQFLFDHGTNFLILGTSRPVSSRDMHIPASFWDTLFEYGIRNNSFAHIELFPLTEAEVHKVVAHYRKEAAGGCQSIPSSKSKDDRFSRDVFLQSGGNPRLVCGGIEKWLLEGSEHGSEGGSVEVTIIRGETKDAFEGCGMAEHILHQMDALPAIVRTHVNLGAILGLSFKASDVIRVMEIYRGVLDEELQEHSEFVHQSLNEAVWRGVLERDEEGFCRSDWELESGGRLAGKYKFAHEVWRDNILKHTLGDWQRDMQDLIAEFLGPTSS